MSDFVTFGTYFLWKINYIVGFYVPRNNLKLRAMFTARHPWCRRACKITTIEVDNLIFAVRRTILAHVVYHTLVNVLMDVGRSENQRGSIYTVGVICPPPSSPCLHRINLSG